MSSPKWEPLWIDGGYSPTLRARANGAAGAYAIRSKATHVVQYVGESSTGNLWRTLLRHFQAPESFRKVRESFTGSAPHYEVAIHVTTPGNGRRKPPIGSKRPRPFSHGRGDQKALDKQAEWIETLRPASNRDDGKVKPPEPETVTCPECGGSGEEEGTLGGDCPKCHGSGRVRVSNPSYDGAAVRADLETWPRARLVEWCTWNDANGEWSEATAEELRAQIAEWCDEAQETPRELRRASRRNPAPPSAKDDAAEFVIAARAFGDVEVSGPSGRVSDEHRRAHPDGGPWIVYDGKGHPVAWQIADRELADWLRDSMRAAAVDARIHRKVSEAVGPPPVERGEWGYGALRPGSSQGAVYRVSPDGRETIDVCQTGTVLQARFIAQLAGLGFSFADGFAKVKADRAARRTVGASHDFAIGDRVQWESGTGKDYRSHVGTVRELLPKDELSISGVMTRKRGGKQGLSEPYPFRVHSRELSRHVVAEKKPKKPKAEPKPKREPKAPPKQSLPAPDAEWWQELPDRSGLFDYVELVRAPGDPERKPRPKTGEARDVAPHLTLRKTTAVEWARRIEAHLADGVPRTLNRIAVEMVDKTADVVATTTFRDGLWLLVARGRVEYTPESPIFFRRVAAAALPVRNAAQLLRAIEAGPAHSLAVAELRPGELENGVAGLLAGKEIARLPARGRWPDRLVVTSRGSHVLGTFASADDGEDFRGDVRSHNEHAKRARLAREVQAAAVVVADAARTLAEKPAGYGAVETGKRRTGQLRMFNPAELVGDLYHVTYAKHLASIARSGLKPSGGRGIGANANLGEHSRGSVFLTERGGVPFWRARLEDHANDQSDDPRKDKLAPVTLRVLRPVLVIDDEPGSSDSIHGAAYMAKETIKPSELEFFYDGAWSPIADYKRLDVRRAYDEDGYLLDDYSSPLVERERAANPGRPLTIAKERGGLVQLGLLTELETERGRFAWSLKDAPVLANDDAGRLFIVYAGRIVRSSSAEEIKRYRRTHWGRSGGGKVREGGVAVGPFTSHGPAVSITYTTTKGIDRGLVDYVHPFGEGGPKTWKPPVLVEHVCRGCEPKCASAGALGLVGGTYRVTDRGIVG